jgi:hypothetical protein
MAREAAEAPASGMKSDDLTLPETLKGASADWMVPKARRKRVLTRESASIPPDCSVRTPWMSATLRITYSS